MPLKIALRSTVCLHKCNEFIECLLILNNAGRNGDVAKRLWIAALESCDKLTDVRGRSLYL